MTKKNTGDPIDEAAGNVTFAENNEQNPPASPAISADSSAEPVVYCGPTLPRKLVSMSVYRNGLPANIAALAGEIPEIGRLIVPVSHLSETRKKAETPGTEENRLYQAILRSRRSN
jgi:hypothetical protein